MTCRYCVTKTTCSKLRKCSKTGARLYTAQVNESSAESAYGFSQTFYEERNSSSYSECYSGSDSSGDSGSCDSGSCSSCD